jgi:hypothetical protein
MKNSTLTIMLFLIISCSGCSKPEKIYVSPTTLKQCDRSYDETTYDSVWTSGNDASVSFNLVSGDLKLSPSTKKTNTTKVTWRMDQDKFFVNCSPGNKGVWSSACPYYQKCVSIVKHSKSDKPSSIELLDYEGVARFIKRQQVGTAKTSPTRNCHGIHCPVKDACDVVSSTYNPVVVGNSIFQYIPEIDYEEAQQLGIKAVKGYGACLCALHNYTEVEDDFSIGYCVGERYVECNSRNGGAYCGRELRNKSVKYMSSDL